MKNITLFILLFTTVIWGQETTIRSKAGKLVQTESQKEANIQGQNIKYKTQFLVADIEFYEPSGNNMLDADEEAKVIVKVKNIGSKSASNCNIQLQTELPNKDITIIGSKIFPEIKPNFEVITELRINASKNISDGQVKFLLKVMEKDGFDLDPVKILYIPTRKFQPPILEIVDYGIIDENKDLKITKREEVELTVRVQNKGANTAYGVVGKINYGANIFTDSTNNYYYLGDLQSGDYKDIKSNFYTNNRATSIKFDVSVADKTNNYFAFRSFEIPMDVQQNSPDAIIIPKIETANNKIETVKIEKLDLAMNIPQASIIDKNSIAIIIGSKNYKYAPKVDYAINDAAMVKNYINKAFGYDKENIFYLEDASLKDFISFFGKEGNYKGKLYDYVKPNLSSIFIYYSGHGAPGLDTKDSYIVPIDCDPNKVELDGYALKTLYENIDKIAFDKNIKNVVVVMDACFSGLSEAGSLLKNISPIYINVSKQYLKYPNAALITSASSNQVSSWYKQKEQSLFTYFFLLGLKGEADFNKDGIITTREIYEFTADEVNGVPYWARRLNGKAQNPDFYGVDCELIKIKN